MSSHELRNVDLEDERGSLRVARQTLDTPPHPFRCQEWNDGGHSSWANHLVEPLACLSERSNVTVRSVRNYFLNYLCG
jgi:hypothetical protein